jgi:hypothetical protein
MRFRSGVGTAMVWFAATGYCILANGLYWLGAGAEPAPAPPAACPDVQARATFST